MLRPSCLTALALVAVNDWLFKGADWFPQLLAGKLSDFGGLFYFPFLCYDIILLPSARERRTSNLFVFLLFATAVVFTLAKLPGVARTVILEVARVVSPFSVTAVIDPTDLFALLVLPVAWRVFDERRRPAASGVRN